MPRSASSATRSRVTSTGCSDGRRNYYRIKADRPLRHPVERGHDIGEILSVLHEADAPQSSSPAVLAEASPHAVDLLRHRGVRTAIRTPTAQYDDAVDARLRPRS